MKRVICLFLILFSSALQAQTAPEPCRCAPFENSADWYALVVSHNLVGGPGPWLRWHCYPQRIPVGSTASPEPVACTIAQPWGAIDLRKLGDRVETIRASADPIAAFRASWKRHVTLPLSDPSLAELRAAIAASIPASAASAP